MSLIVITMLGATAVVGIQATSINMRDAADREYKAHGLYDIQLKSVTGFNSGDVDAVRETEGAAVVLPTYIFDVYLDVRTDLRPVRTYALPEELNTVRLMAGRLPINAREIAVEPRVLREGGFSIGDVISFSLSDMEAYSSVFETEEFTITGTVTSPLYVTFERGRTTLGNGTLRYYAYLHPDAYIIDVYTDIYVLMENSGDIHNVSEQYKAAADVWKRRFEDTGEVRSEVFREELRDAQIEIDDGWAEYYDGLRELEEELAEARTELSDAEVKLNDARAELNDAQETLDREISDGLEEILRREAELFDGQAQINAQWDTLFEGQLRMDQARAELEAGLAALMGIAPQGVSPELDAQYEQISHALAALAGGHAELNAGWAALHDAQSSIDSGREQLREARLTLEKERAEAQLKIDDGWDEYTEGAEEYDDGLMRLAEEEADARNTLNDAHEELVDAQSKLDDAPDPEWFVFTRESGTAFESYYQDTLRLQSVGYVFPMVFFLVAILVSLTSMTRLVEEHRTQIGVYKALGYRPAAILLKYVLYALLCSISGSVLGVIAGSNLFPMIIGDAYGHLYDMPPMERPIPLGIAAFAVVVTAALLTAVTLMTCIGAMRCEPADLMRPKAPKAGKRVMLERIRPVWKRMGFISKVTARNIFRYKKRLLMTLAGIAGCAALLLTAFGLRDSIGSVALIQYGDIIEYDAIVYTSEVNSTELREQLEALTPEARLFIREESVTVGKGSGGTTAALVIPEDFMLLREYVNFLNPTTGKPAPEHFDGAVITEKLARTWDIAVGDIFTLTTPGGAAYLVKAAGIVENYIQHFVYLPPEDYTEMFGRELKPNAMLLSGDVDAEGILENSKVRAVIQTASLVSSISDSTDVLGVVTVVLIVSACALAFVVLFNLTLINVTERTRELATIKVLGFQDTETATYIYREILFITLMGIALGIFGGIGLTTFVLRSVEIDMLKFPHVLRPVSFALSAALSVAFALFVNLVTYRRLVRIDMVESLKSVD